MSWFKKSPGRQAIEALEAQDLAARDEFMQQLEDLIYSGVPVRAAVVSVPLKNQLEILWCNTIWSWVSQQLESSYQKSIFFGLTPNDIFTSPESKPRFFSTKQAAYDVSDQKTADVLANVKRELEAKEQQLRAQQLIADGWYQGDTSAS